MNNLILTAIILLSFSTTLMGQQVINLTSDLVLTETLVITESITYEGNGNKIICEGCSPMIRVEGEVEVRFNNVIFEKTYVRWLENEAGSVFWNGPRMRGYIIWDLGQ